MRKGGRKRGKHNNRSNQDNNEMGAGGQNVGNKLTSPPISVYLNREENDFYQASIDFYGIDLSGPSYEGRVYVNNPKADEHTSLDEKSGYVGSYHIFGHNGCFGDEGHCEIPRRRAYDSRSKSDVTPCFKTLDATRVIRKYIESGDQVVVTVIPIIAKGGRMSDTKDVVHIERIRISCYEKALKGRD
jgi:hypothetical protein